MKELLECQKEFLFNAEYNNEYHPTYNALKYHCKKTDLRMEIDVDMIAEDDLSTLIRNDTTVSLTGTSLCTYAIEPPYTERYVRWCGRTAIQLMDSLLPDYSIGVYCAGQASDEMQGPLSRATAVYGHYADAYFNS